MELATLKLTFTEDLQVGQSLAFDCVDESENTLVSVQENWVEIRRKSNEVSLGKITEVPGEATALNFARAFEIDYAPTGLFEGVSLNQNEVVITGSEGVFFDSETFQAPGSLAPVFSNPLNSLSITNIELEAATDCKKIKVNITTNVQADSITSPVSQLVFSNPFSIVVDRGLSYLVKVTNGNDEATSSFTAPERLFASAFNPQIDNTPNGITVTFLGGESNFLDYEFSIDGENWQESNIFPNLLPGGYTFKIRDQYGCSVSYIINLNSEYSGIPPYFYISKSNPIVHVKKESFGNCGPYKNDENTLSCESTSELPWTEIHEYQSCDSRRIQFQSSYPENRVFAIQENGNEIELPVTKLTSNFGRKDKRSAKRYRVAQNQTGIYFINGDLYDYNSSTVTGDYTLNGELPEWGEVGNYMKIESLGQWFEIKNIYFDPEKNADVLIINLNTTVPGALTEIVSSNYNLEDFEVFEYALNFNQFENETISIRINSGYLAYNENQEEVIHVSELIRISERVENSLAIQYKHRENTDIMYSSGIEHLMRLRVEKINGRAIDETENHKTDVNTILLSSDVYPADEFEFSPVTKNMMRTLVLALSHSDVVINGVNYVKESIEIEGPLEETNLYLVKALMVKAGLRENYKLKQNTSNGIEMPGLLEVSEGGYFEI